jgi:trimeric autotransporter adhesin
MLFRRPFVYVAFGFLLTVSGAIAQIRSGTITGGVTDPSHAAIPDAEVTVTNTATNISNTTKTTQAGAYTVPYLETGTYLITIVKTGFETFKATDVRLDSSQTARVDATLTLGSTGALVEVRGSLEQLQTDSSSVSGAIDAQVIDSIPNITQNPLYYAGLQNGVQPRNETSSSTSVGSFGIGVAGRAQFSAYGVNGGRAFENDIQLDGLPIMGGGFNEAAILPNTEGLQEVRVINNNFTAEYGHGQSVISLSTKSGTNQFHGEATYLLRNEALNANTNSNNANLLTRSAFKVNQWGGALSGPIIKNKLFFFSSYHYLMFNQGQNDLSTVPTDLERVGNFSKTLINVGGTATPAQVYNPFSVTQLATDLYQRAPYPNGIIPNPNPYAVHMYSFYPEPNRIPDDVYNTNNYASAVVNTVRRQTLNNRVDYRWGKQSFYGSGGFDFGDVAQPRPFGVAPFNNAPTVTNDRNPYGQIGDTIVITPTLVADIRYGVTRINTNNLGGNRSGFTDYASFGIPASTQALFEIYGAAPIVLPNNFSGGSGGGSNWTGLSSGQFVNKQERQLSHSLNGSITKIHGNWTHKVGTEVRVLLSNYQDLEEASAEIASCCANVGGNFTFQYTTAAGSPAPQNTSTLQNGINGAALLTGENVWWVRPGENVTPAFAQKYFAVYSQNDWRASSKLTINLGLRWDLQPGPTERYNRFSTYDFTAKNPFGTLGGIAFPGSDGYSRNLWDTEYHDFGPRLGAAYRLKSDLVIRGGFGISFLPSNTGYFSSPNEYGASSFSAGTQMLPYGTTPAGVPVTTFNQSSPIVAPTGTSITAPQIYGGSNALFTRQLKNQIAKQTNVFIEKSLGKGGHEWLLSAGYSGSFSNHLSNRNYPFENMQNIPASTLSTWLTQYIASNGQTNPANVQVQNPWQPATGPLLPFTGTLAGRTIPQFVTMLPYPLLYGSGAGVDESNGYASYNSLQLRMRHAFSAGLHVEVNYTWSKELDYTSTAIEDGQGVNSGGTIGSPNLLNNSDNRRYGLSDQPNRFVAIVMYDSPFGAGKSLALSNRVAQELLGGWSTGGVVTVNSGFPFVISGANTGALSGAVNEIPGVSLTVPANLQQWYDGKTTVTLPCGLKVTPAKNTFLKYNQCAFQGEVLTAPNGSTIANQFWFGNSNETNGNLRGPDRFNIDLSLRRSFAIRERIKLQISADATNLLNHAEYNGNFNGALGNTVLSGPTTGYGTSTTFGTLGVGTFDQRQVTMHVRVSF